MEKTSITREATPRPGLAVDTRRGRHALTRNGGPDGPTGVGLCLSGGGYRAMLFHLGVLWRLNETGWLPRLDHVSSVSGGSLTAGALGLAWPHLGFTREGVGTGFEVGVVAPLRALAGRRIDVRSVVIGALVPGTSAGKQLAGAYRRHLFGPATLQDLPDQPRFVFNATNLASGALARFSKPYLADWRVGRIERPKLELAVTVACSSAFPPPLSPFHLSLKDQKWLTEVGNDLTGPEYRSRWLLSDGGVYDKLGLESAWKRCRTLIVSDASGQTRPQPHPASDWGRHTLRTLRVIDGQVRALRTRQTIAGFERGERDGFYIGIRGDISRYRASDRLPAPRELTLRLAGIRTRLAPLDPLVQERLINWGYAICDAGLRRSLDPGAGPPAGFPYPGAGVG